MQRILFAFFTLHALFRNGILASEDQLWNHGLKSSPLVSIFKEGTTPARPLNTSDCPSASGASCFAFPASEPPEVSDAMTLLAIDLATFIYNNSTAVVAYAQNALGATSVQFITNNKTDTQAAVAAGDDVIIVAMRGSESETDLMIDLLINMTKTSFGAVGGTADVHSGFLKAVESIYDTLVDTLKEMESMRSRKLYFTG